jgi:hypothetical protein
MFPTEGRLHCRLGAVLRAGCVCDRLSYARRVPAVMQEKLREVAAGGLKFVRLLFEPP